MQTTRTYPPHPPQRGQATTETVLLIAVITIAVVAAGYGLAATFASDMESAGERAATVYTTGNLAH